MKHLFPPIINKEPVFNYNPVDLAQKSIDGNFNSQVWDPKLEKDIYYAKNWFEWLSSSEFLNIVPFGKQVEIGAKYFEDYCPKCSDLRFLDGLFNESISEMQDRITWLEDGVCPKCKLSRNYWYKEINKITGKPYFMGVNEFHGCCGQRSSKSTLASMAASYVLHRFIQIPVPSQYFNQLTGQKFDMTFVALNAKTAYDNLWAAFKSRLESPWFKYYLEWANDIKKKTGNTLIVDNQTFLTLNHKNIKCSYAASDSRTLRGFTRFWTSIDELGFYDANSESTKVTQNASETRTSLTNSLATIRAAAALKRKKGNHNVVDAYEFNISSPCSANDPIMRLVKTATKKNNAISIHLASWEMNPQLDQETLRLQQDPDKLKDFDRDFGAIPPLANSPFINDKNIVINMFSNQYQTINIRIKEIFEASTKQVGFQWIELIKSNLDNTPRILTVDPGYSNNAFGMMISHIDTEQNKLVVDWCYQLKPKTVDNILYKINFPKLFDSFIYPIIQSMNTIAVIYDRWNSLDQTQRLLDKGINAFQYSLTYKDFDKIIKPALLGDQLIFPKCEMNFEELEPATAILDEIVINRPILHLAIQLLTVRDLGKKIAKPESGDDDLFRTLALGVWYMKSPDGKKLLGKIINKKDKKSQIISVARKRSLSTNYSTRVSSSIIINSTRKIK